MRPLAVSAPDPRPVETPVGPQPAALPARNATHDNVHLLQRTQALVNDQPADARYWTAYDRFMLEREARAIRRAYLGGLIAGAWRRLRERVAVLRRLPADAARPRALRGHQEPSA
jgi:hypothetical protein